MEEIYKDLNSPKSKEFEKLLNSEFEQKKLTEEQFNDRRNTWKPIEAQYTSGVFAKYAKLVSSASEGAVTG